MEDSKQGKGDWASGRDLLLSGPVPKWGRCIRRGQRFPPLSTVHNGKPGHLTWSGLLVSWKTLLKYVGYPLILTDSSWCAKLRISPDQRQVCACEPSLLHLTPQYTLTHAQFWGSLVSRGCALTGISLEWPSILFWSLFSPISVTLHERSTGTCWQEWEETAFYGSSINVKKNNNKTSYYPVFGS